MAQGVLVGMLVAVLFALVPLLRVRRVRPSLLLRRRGRRERRHRLGARVRRRHRRHRAGGRCRLAGRLAARRPRRLRRVPRDHARAARRRLAAGVAREAAPPREVVRRPPRGAEPRSPGQPDAHGAAGRRTRAASSSSAFGRSRRNLLDSLEHHCRRRLARHVPDRHPAGSGGAACHVPDAAHRAGAAADAAARAARACHRGERQADLAREARRRPRARLARPRIHDHLSSRAAAKRAAWSRADSGTRRRRRRRRSRSKRACAIASRFRWATPSASTSSDCRSRRKSPACAPSTGVTPVPAASCSCSGPDRSTRRRTAS